MRRVIPVVLVVCSLGIGLSFGRPHRVSQSPLASIEQRSTVEPARMPAPKRSARNANYAIEVRLDTPTRTLTGREAITWRNVSRIAAGELRFHLYYNAWKNNRSTFAREDALVGIAGGPSREEDLGHIDVTTVRLLTGGPAIDLTATIRYISPDDGNTDDRTVMSVALPQAVQPGETISIGVEWISKIPRTVARTGVVGNFYFFGQWFPKIGVLEDEGWNCHQFHSSTEFFADYGVYDVAMTVPTRWVVGATGVERDHHDNTDGTTTWNYHEEDVHDFAWTTSPDYVERRALFEHAGLPPVTMRLLLQPEHAAQAERHFAATRAALRYYGEWFGAYPYGHITVVDPAWHSGAGGMEYPTLFTAGTAWLAARHVTSPEEVTIHECGHQFWYALVGNNEFEDAWLDEGLNTYSTARVIEQAYKDENHAHRRFFGRFVPYVFADIPLSRVDDDGLASYRTAARIDVPSRPSYRYWPDAAGPLSYSKTALWLHTLENYLGWPTFRACLATYFQRFEFRHPKPGDFFQVLGEVSGRDLRWFLDQVHNGTRIFDYGVDVLRTDRERSAGIFDRNGRQVYVNAPATESRAYRTTVVVRRYGDGIFPVDVVVRFANGERVRDQWDGRDEWKAYTYERRVPAVSAEVDPDHVLALDVDPANNSRMAEPPTGEAATKWTLTWMVWLQDLLLTYAYFV